MVFFHPENRLKALLAPRMRVSGMPGGGDEGGSQRRSKHDDPGTISPGPGAGEQSQRRGPRPGAVPSGGPDDFKRQPRRYEPTGHGRGSGVVHGWGEGLNRKPGEKKLEWIKRLIRQGISRDRIRRFSQEDDARHK